MVAPARKRATLDDYLAARGNGRPVELVDGAVVEKASPTMEHGSAQSKTVETLGPFHRRAGGPRGPGGWWLATEVEVLYAQTSEVFRHDIVGFRRDTHPERPSGAPLRLRPDWVTEILSPSTSRVDQVKKLRTLHAHGVAHYWILDPERETLTVHRHAAEGYLTVLSAGPDEVVRAEPFDAIEIDVGELFGHER